MRTNKLQRIKKSECNSAVKYNTNQHNDWWLSLEDDGAYINTPSPHKIIHMDYLVGEEVFVYTNENTYTFPIMDGNHADSFGSFFLHMESRNDYIGDTKLHEDKTEMSLRLAGDQHNNQYH